MKSTFTYFPLITLFLFFASSSFAQVQLGTDINGANQADEAGTSIALSADGKVLAVGSPLNDDNGFISGTVQIFQRNGMDWTQMGTNINGEAEEDQSGNEVALSGDGTTVAIGTWLNDGNGISSGHVRVFEWDGGDWVQIGADFDGEQTQDRLGSSIDLSFDGSIVAMGATSPDNNGYVKIYERNGNDWSQLGATIIGEELQNFFGASVSLTSAGNRLAIGATGNSANGNNSGHVRAFQWDGTNWTQMGADIDGAAENDRFGRSIDLSANDGNTLAIGATGNDANGNSSGHVRVFQWDGTNWNQMGAAIDGAAESDYFGAAVSLSYDGTALAIGAPGSNGNGNDSGQVKMYESDGTNWTQLGTAIDGEDFGDDSGQSTALSADGSILAIGAPGNNGIGTNSGHVRIYTFASLSPVSELPQNQVSLFPNPTTGMIHFEGKRIDQIELIDLHGKVLLLRNTPESVLDISTLSNGIYNLRITIEDQVFTKRVVKM